MPTLVGWRLNKATIRPSFWASCIRSTSWNQMSPTSNSILSSHLHVELVGGLFDVFLASFIIPHITWIKADHCGWWKMYWQSLMYSRVVAASLEMCGHRRYGQKKKSCNLENCMKNSRLLMVSVTTSLVASLNIWLIIFIHWLFWQPGLFSDQAFLFFFSLL